MLQENGNLKVENDIFNSTTNFDESSETWDLTLYTADVVAYTAGFVIKILRKCITCHQCILFLEGKVIISHLQQHKQYGRLVSASYQTVEICKTAEKYLRFYLKTEGIFNNKNKKLISVLVHNTFRLLLSGLFHSFEDHLYDDDLIEGRVYTLIKLILKK